MELSKHFITLDLQKQSASVIVPLKHGENGKQIVISIADGGFPYAISNDCYAVLTAQKPDGNVLYNHCTINENTIIYDVTEQTTAVVGTFPAAINLYGAGDVLLISSKFRFIVDGTIYSEGEVVSAPEVSALTHLISEATTTIATGNQTIQEGVAATEAATNAANSANTAAERANSSASAANASAERANTATNAANTAAGNAQASSQAANSAAASANEAAGKANNATEAANDAADEANKATENANEAATKAAHTAKSLMVVGEATGTNIYLEDAIDQFLVGCRIFGKTTQDGTPTPDNPVELVSVGGNGSITVNVTGEKESQSMTLATPNGLPGIPVTEGGNYTDANGQQWFCDEIDFETGVYIQRIRKITSAQLASVGAVGKHDNGLTYLSVWADGVTNKFAPLSTHYEGWIASTRSGRCYCTMNGLVVNDDRFTDQSTARSIMGSEDSVFLCPLATPIETPLSEEELAAYASLHTYKDHTTVTNDAGAYMELEYVMDAKKYIDSLVISGGASAGIIDATVE